MAQQYWQVMRQVLAGGSLHRYAEFFLDTVAGDNGNHGRAPDKPVKDWGQLPGKGAGPGGKVKIKTGSTVPVATVFADNLTIEAYGTGPAPVIESIDLAGHTEPAIDSSVVYDTSGKTWANITTTWAAETHTWSEA